MADSKGFLLWEKLCVTLSSLSSERIIEDLKDEIEALEKEFSDYRMI